MACIDTVMIISFYGELLGIKYELQKSDSIGLIMNDKIKSSIIEVILMGIKINDD